MLKSAPDCRRARMSLNATVAAGTAAAPRRRGWVWPQAADWPRELGYGEVRPQGCLRGLYARLLICSLDHEAHRPTAQRARLGRPGWIDPRPGAWPDQAAYGTSWQGACTRQHWHPRRRQVAARRQGYIRSPKR